MYVKTYEHGCPLCKGVVKGNFRYKYFCKKCNLIFRESELDDEKKLIK